jgi:cytochrome c heme-lyase
MSRCTKEGNSSCPVDSSSQTPSESGDATLSSTRQTSTIPTKNGTPWIYPSEKMFFEAMERKKNGKSQNEVKTIIPIHNEINEKAWLMVTKWESLLYNNNPSCPLKLVKFIGNSKKYTPKALFNHYFLGYKLPFDRHDWTVERNCNEEYVYVIDFYNGQNDGERGAIYMDVRPKFTMRGAIDRVRHFWKTFEFY